MFASFSLQPLRVSAVPKHTGDYKQEVEEKKEQTAADKNKEVNAIVLKLEHFLCYNVKVDQSDSSKAQRLC